MSTRKLHAAISDEPCRSEVQELKEQVAMLTKQVVALTTVEADVHGSVSAATSRDAPSVRAPIASVGSQGISNVAN